jgi:hypothetical protein
VGISPVGFELTKRRTRVDSADFSKIFRVAKGDALLGEALAWMKNGWEGFNTRHSVDQPSLCSSGIMTRRPRGVAGGVERCKSAVAATLPHGKQASARPRSKSAGLTGEDLRESVALRGTGSRIKV